MGRFFGFWPARRHLFRNIFRMREVVALILFWPGLQAAKIFFNDDVKALAAANRLRGFNSHIIAACPAAHGSLRQINVNLTAVEVRPGLSSVLASLKRISQHVAVRE